ncbi:MAG: NUDIX domain-containing protein [Pseudomonadota bacterium]|nr:NUDIX domain-containing protein [Pseudomonadota bacterium]
MTASSGSSVAASLPSAGSGTLDADWMLQCQARHDLPPARPRVPLALAIGRDAGRVVGSLEPELATELAGTGRLRRGPGSAWHLEVRSAADVNSAWAALADSLLRAGRVSGWRGELLDVLDADGDRCGAIERAAVRALGMSTRAVHLVLSDPAGHVWVQQRALDKAVDPGLWDTTVGGLVAAGESIETTLERETWEEAGLRPVQFGRAEPFGRFTVRRPVADGYMVEHIDMFRAVAAPGVVPRNQDGEVAGFECLARAELIERIRAGVFTGEAALVLAHWSLAANQEAGPGNS